MKNLLLLLFLFFASNNIWAQSKISYADRPELIKTAPGVMYNLQGQDIGNIDVPMISPDIPLLQANSRNASYFEVGSTYYDLQSNASVQNRLAKHENGSMSATWTMSQGSDGNTTDRGTGYNFYDGTTWGAWPTSRLESLRSGWPGLTQTSDGLDLVFGHATATNPYSLNAMTRAQGEIEWTETNLPFGTPTGMLWPRSAIGGTNNQTVHAIAITTPVGFPDNGGALYEGMDGKLLYYRSPDGGLTWDIFDQSLEGLDTNFYKVIAADRYSIAARGNTVAIALHTEFGDVALWKSTDNGDTFEKTIVRDFIFDGYALDDGYTFEDIAMDYDTLYYPDSMALFTNDGAGSVIIDNNDMVHMAFGEKFVTDEDLSDDGFRYFIVVSGMAYWNESMGAGNAQTLSFVDDEFVGDNGTIDIASADEVAAYGVSLTGMPTLAVDEENTIYMVYSCVRENYFDAVNDNQYYRHLMITKSFDAGANWLLPDEVSNYFPPEIPSEFIASFEMTFPYIYPYVDDKIEIIYQQDFRPGLASIVTNADPVELNVIIHLSLDKDYEVVINTEAVKDNLLNIELSPNPTNDMVKIAYALEAAATVDFAVYDLLGKQILSKKLGLQQKGTHNEILSVTNLTPGIYLFYTKVGNAIKTSKLIVE